MSRPAMTVRALVIGDEAQLRELVRGGLGGYGYEVVTAAGAAAGLARAERERFDVVVCEAAMPGLTGAELIRKLRAREPELPVILLSDERADVSATECARLGAFDVLRRPFAVDLLEKLVMRAVEVRRIRAENTVYRAARELARQRTRGGVAGAVIEIAGARFGASAAAVVWKDELGRVEKALPGPGEAAAIAKGWANLDGPREAQWEATPEGATWLLQPIARGAACGGCLVIGRAADRQPFGPRDLQWAAALAGQASVALENAEQIEQLVQANEAARKVASSRGERIVLEKLPTPNATLPSGASAANNEEPARQMAQVSLSRVAQAAVEIMRPTTKHACIVGVTGAADDVVQGDARLLTYMLVNLMVDALHAMPKSNGTIDLKILPGPDEVAIEVRDNASAASAERVRVLASLAGGTATMTGMRLSLTISADVLRRHGGRLEAEAAPDDEGTVVTVWIPRRPTPKKSEARPRQAAKSSNLRVTTLRMQAEERKKRFTTGNK